MGQDLPGAPGAKKGGDVHPQQEGKMVTHTLIHTCGKC